MPTNCTSAKWWKWSRRQRCAAWTRGECPKGDQCYFQHSRQGGIATLHCHDYITSICTKGNKCRFSHRFTHHSHPIPRRFGRDNLPQHLYRRDRTEPAQHQDSMTPFQRCRASTNPETPPRRPRRNPDDPTSHQEPHHRRGVPRRAPPRTERNPSRETAGSERRVPPRRPPLQNREGGRIAEL